MFSQRKSLYEAHRRQDTLQQWTEIWSAGRVQGCQGGRALGLEGLENHVKELMLRPEGQGFPQEGFNQEKDGILLTGGLSVSTHTAG